MSVVKVTAFGGEQPRIAPRLLPPTGARSAINVRLDDGILTPYRQPTEEQVLAGPGPYQSIYKLGNVWLAFTNVVNAAPGPVADDRLYYTGNGAPKLRVDGTTTYDLKLNPPTAAPGISTAGTGSGTVTTRIYAYTFVTSLGEESEPSPASAEVNWQTGITVTLTGIQDAPGSPARGITKQRFYRSQSGTVGTDFYFIAERAVSASNFVDTVAADAFAEPLPSRNWTPPPDNLAGLIPLPNGMMAAFVGKQLYFCEPFRPHAWPDIYVMTIDVPIVALAATATTIWVLTEGVPYRVSGTTPTTMVAEKIEANLPCINARGVVDLGYAVAWPSTDGLAVARLDGSVALASTNLFSPAEWRRLNPGTMRAGQVTGRWIGSYSATNDLGQPISGSLIIDLSDKSFLIRSAIQASTWFYDIASGSTFFINAAGSALSIQEFDSFSGAPDLLYWRSKQFVLPAPDTMGCILIEGGAGVSQFDIDARNAEIAAVIAANAALLASSSGIGGDLGALALADVSLAGDLLAPVPPSIGTTVTINVYADERLVATVGTFDRPMRLPAGFKGRIWEIDVFSDIKISQITMARTVDELKQAANGP